MSTSRRLALLLALAGGWRILAAQAAGAPAREESRVAPAPSGAPEASEILRASALAPVVPYAGEVSVVTWYGKQARTSEGDARSRDLLVHFAPPNRFRRELVDRYGYTTQVIVSDGKIEWFFDRSQRKAWKTIPEDADYKVLGPEEEFELLAQNYDIRLLGQETIAGRACWVLEIRAQKGGRVVRSLWIDKRHGVVLQAKAFQADGSVASTMRFLKIEFPPRLDAELFRFAPPAGAAVVTSPLKPGYLELEDAQTASGVAPRHPGWLPSGYVFESVNVLPYRGSTFLHFRYSDGIDALSLFQCPSSASLDFGGLPQEKLRVGAGRGRLSFGPDGKILEWPRHGQRFVLVGNLPLDALRRVAESVQ